MSGSELPATRSPIQRILRRRDQVVLAVLLGMGWLLVGGGWLVAGGHRGRLVDIDRAGRLDFEFRVDINRATWPELALLPRIGETLAQRIVAHRERCGAFQRVEDLQDVRGIGPRTLDRLRPWVEVSPAASVHADERTVDRRGSPIASE